MPQANQKMQLKDNKTTPRFDWEHPNGDRNDNAYSHGDEVTIAGAGFGSLPTFLFAGGATGRIETGSIGADSANTGGFLLSAERPKEIAVDPERGNVWRSEISDGNSGTGDNGVIVGDWGSQVPSGSRQLVQWFSKIESDATQYQWKQYRNEITNNFVDGGPEQVISGWLSSGGRYFMNRPDVDPGSAGASTNYASVDGSMQPLATPTWMAHRIYTQFSDTDTANGTTAFETLVNGNQHMIFRSTALKHFGAGITDRYRYHVWQNYGGNFSNGEPTYHRVWMDDLYIQVAGPGVDLISVYLCDTPNFADRTVCEFQRPLSGWSNTSAKIELNRGGLSDGEYYLVVVANENTQLASKQITLTSSEWMPGDPPVINSASGTFADGNIITLSGSNFSTQNSSQLYFTNFADGVVGQRYNDFYYWNMTGTADYLIADDVVAPIGSGKVLKAHPVQQNFTEIHYELDEDTDEIFVEQWIRINKIDFTSSPDAQQIKMPRVVDGMGEDATQNRPLRIDLLIQADGTLQITTGPEVGAGAWYQKAGTPNLDNDSWYKLLIYFKKGTYGVADGMRFLKIGDLNEFRNSAYPTPSPIHFASPLTGSVPPAAFAGEPIINHTDTTAPYQFRRVTLTYFQRLQQETESFLAQVRINNSRESVIIGDGATWETCTHRITHGADTVLRQRNTIQFVAETGHFESGPVYAYVVNHDGTYNSNGYLVRAA